MKLSGESKFFLGIIIVTLIVVIAGIFFFSRTAPTFSREELLPAGVTTQGNKEAEVFLVEFSDFQCPACKSFQAVVKDILSNYKDQLYFGYRHFPLLQHEFAEKASLAAEAAGEQGKFWEMHDYLFENQESLSDETIIRGAEKLGLDKVKFEESYNNKKYEEKVNKDLSDGKRFGVDATPTFFLNGKKLDLFSQSDLQKTVAEAINKK